MMTRKILMSSMVLAAVLGASIALADEPQPQASAPSTPDYVLLSLVKVKADKVLDFKKLLLPCSDRVRGERGNGSYLALQSPDDPTQFEMVEHWKSDDARSAHLAARYTIEFFARATPLFETGYPARTKYIELKSGDY